MKKQRPRRGIRQKVRTDADRPLKGEVQDAHKADIEKARALGTAATLWTILRRAEEQARGDPVMRLKLAEASRFMEAIDDGGQHPLLDLWKQRTFANRPAPGSGERSKRHLAVLCSIALERALLNKRRARRLVAEKLAQLEIFAKPPTAAAIEHWQRDDGPLTADDEAILSEVLTRCGHDHDQIIRDFVGRLAVRFDPVVRRKLELLTRRKALFS